MRSTRFLILPIVMMATALDGCSVAPRDTRAAYEPITDATATAMPMAQLSPGAGEVISVLENRAAGVLTQRIILKGDALTGGENQIIVKVDQNPRRPLDVDGPVPKPSEGMIQTELDENFTNVDMRMSLTYNHNSFGPFGYAIGHPPQGVTCIYAWQWSAGRPARIIDSPGAFASGQSMPTAPTSVRARLCKSGVGETEIVAMLRDMQIYPPKSSEPYVDPSFEAAAPAGRDALASAGVPGSFFLGPKTGASATVAASEPAPRAAKHARRHIAARQRHRGAPRVVRYEAAPVAAAAIAAPVVNVPLPGGAPVAAAVATPPMNPLLAPLQGGGGLRSTAAADEMPLPGRAPPAPRAAAPAPVEAKPVVAPIPLPN